MLRPALLLAACSALACTSPERPSNAPQTADAPRTAADSQAAHAREVAASGGTVDSILPVAEMLQRFQATTAGRPDSLRHASASRESLVRRFGKALASRDTAALNAMLLDRAEYAWLYYPESKLSKPPYEAPPALLWEQLLSGSDEGIRKALSKYAGQAPAAGSLTCERIATEGENRLHEDCQLGGVRLFGAILERDGRFKFLSFANGL